MSDPSIERLRRIVAAFKAGDYEAALAACRAALAARAPDDAPNGATDFTPDPRVLFLAGSAARRLGHVADWVEYFTRTVALEPSNVDAHYEIGVGLRILGDGPGARDHFERVVALDPGHAAARYQLAQFASFQPGDPAIDALHARLQAPDTTAADRVWLGFALAKALGDIGAHGRAFKVLTAANALKRGMIDYDVGRDEAFAARLREVFTPALAARLGADDAARGAGEVFVVGMPRSGTTLVEQILAAHGRGAGLIAGMGEVLDLEAAIDAFAQRLGAPFPDCMAAAGPSEMAALGHDYIARVSPSAPGAALRVNKTPANFLYAGVIALALPAARIVHCRRDPLDTCFSCFATLFEQAPYFSYDLEDLARYHNLYTATMAHWRGLFPGRMLELDYEALVADQQGETRRLLDFCGLEWDDACLDFHNVGRSVETASNLQVRKPLYAASVGRASAYAAELAPLAAKLTARPTARLTAPLKSPA